MKTIKKRILSLAMVACLAVTMVATLTACGKKDLEAYFNSDAMQKIVDASVEQYEAQGISCKMYAEGDELRYDFTMNDVTGLDEATKAAVVETLEQGLAGEAQTFVDTAKEVQGAVSNETVIVVVTYFDGDGNELVSQSYSSAD